MTDDDRKKLRELAEAATPGLCTRGCYDGGDGANRNCYARRQAFRAMVDALANPQTVIALLDEIERLRVCYEQEDALTNDLSRQLAAMSAARDEACDMLGSFADSAFGVEWAAWRDRIATLRAVGGDK